MGNAKEVGCYPRNDGKCFKFRRNVVRFTYAYLHWNGNNKGEEGTNGRNV